MHQFGIEYSWKENIIKIEKQNYIPLDFKVEPDWSAASFWYLIVALSGNAMVELSGLKRNSLQGDAVVAEIFEPLGVRTTFNNDSVILTKKDVSCKELLVDFFNTPDLFPPVMSACAGLQIPFRFTGLQNLKIKESDRIKAMITELMKFGYHFTYEQESGVLKFQEFKGFDGETEIICNPHNDHRIAMSIAPLAFLHHSVLITDSDCVSKSYPNYFTDLKSAGFNIF